nr:immunoglobulin light chain junction region [Macaca mulatta]
CYQYFSGHTF